MQACLNALPAVGGTCLVPPNYTETSAANLVFSKKGTTLQFLGPATITMGTFQVTIAAGINGISIIAPYTRSTDQRVCVGVCWNSINTTEAFSIGDSSGFTRVIRFQGFQIADTGSGATDLLLTNVTNSSFDDLETDSALIGVDAEGTGSFFSGLNRVMGLECSSSVANTVCFKGGAIANAWTLVGGHAAINAASGTCIQITGGTGTVIYNFDCDVAQTAITTAANNVFGAWGFLRIDSGVTSFANFGANSFGSHLWTSDCARPVTDNGTAGTNSVECANENQMNGRLYTTAFNATNGVSIQDVTNAYPVMNAAPNGDFALNAGRGAFVNINKNQAAAGGMIISAGVLNIVGVAFASLPIVPNGSIIWCKNCNATCTAGGSTGSFCKRVGGAWTNF